MKNYRSTDLFRFTIVMLFITLLIGFSVAANAQTKPKEPTVKLDTLALTPLTLDRFKFIDQRMAELSDPDYVKKQKELLQKDQMLIVETYLDSKGVKLDAIEPNSLKFENGNLIFRKK